MKFCHNVIIRKYETALFDVKTDQREATDHVHIYSNANTMKGKYKYKTNTKQIQLKKIQILCKAALFGVKRDKQISCSYFEMKNLLPILKIQI